MKSSALSLALSLTLALSLISGFTGSTLSHAQEFQAPKSDMALELLIDLLGGIFNFNLEKMSKVEIVEDAIIASDAQSETKSITLKNKELGEINLRLKTPKKNGTFPTIYVSPGLNAKGTPIDQYITMDDVVIVEIEYPINDRLKGGKMVYEILRKSIKMQLMNTVAINWVKNLPVVNANKISFINISFGTFAAPFSIRVAQLLGLDPYAIVFAYGGSDLKSMILPTLENSMSNADFENVKKPVSKLLDMTAPTNHLPHLQTQSGYLVVNGMDDKLIPKESKALLFERLPDPKEVLEVEGGHIRADQPEMIKKAIAVVLAWLKDQGAI